ncbi:TPA: hypothetical protein ACRR1L_004478, partial [Klebsiella quasipneumoniae]
MASLEENSAWESGIYQLEETDRAQAGAGGVLNIQARQLANRTRFLRSKLASLEGECDELGLSIDMLRSNLGSGDGLKWIGKCKDLSTLRTIEPTISGQSIILERAVVGGPLLNEIITHNPAASDAVDDGYSRFVTAGGAVWDADISFGHNVFLAGYSDALNNLADCLNMIIQDKVN